MAITHGINVSKRSGGVSTPVTVSSGVHFAVGTAPVHTVGGKTNEVIMLNSFDEAASALGYSDEWEKYDLCMEVYSAFQLYNIAPVFVVNVLDPKKQKTSKTSQSKQPEENQILLPFEAIRESVKIQGKTEGTDFTVFYTEKNCVIEFTETTEATVSVSWDEVDSEKVKKSDIIGGYSISEHKSTGMELIDDCFAKYSIAPDLILCPNWSQDAEVAAVMSAKGENINGIFSAIACIDLPCGADGASHYTEVPEKKKKLNVANTNQLACWPRVKLGDRTFAHAVQLAGLITKTDNAGDLGDGTPCEGASNKTMRIDSLVLRDGTTEIAMDPKKAEFLQNNGIITALNFSGGFVSWGNYTAAYPASTDPTEMFYAINRMFQWVGKTVILSYWGYVDRRMSRRLFDTIVQGCNNWLNGLTAEEKILGGRVEMLESENPENALAAGRVAFHVYLTPAAPLQEMDWVLEYDLSYLSGMMA